MTNETKRRLFVVKQNFFQSAVNKLCSRVVLPLKQNAPSYQLQSSFSIQNNKMGKPEYFESTNRLNGVTNLLSGNLLPLSEEKTELSFVMLLWVILVWVVRTIFIMTVLAGSFYLANLSIEEAFKKSAAVVVLFFELIILTIYLNYHRKDFRDLISQFNRTFMDSEDLREIAYYTVDPYKKGLLISVIVCMMTAPSWTAGPLATIATNDQFTYADFAAPAYFPGEPFTVNTFIAGVMLQVFGCSFVSLGKVSLDIYITHFIAVLAAEYKYLRAQLSDALRKEDDESLVISALQACVQRHCDITEMGRKLSDLLALHIAATYLLCIMQLCFLAYGIITFESAPIEKAAYFVYALACIFQLFVLCSCTQELLDESTSITFDAFYENWYWRSNAVKKIFYGIEIGSTLECRMSAYGIVELVVPLLAQILSKSYSVCLLLLEVN